MLKNLLSHLITSLKTKPESKKLYELVEYQIAESSFRDGIRLFHPEFYGVVVTLDPKVKVDTSDDAMKLSFDFSIEYVPAGIVATKPMLHNIVGDIIVDLIQSDHNA